MFKATYQNFLAPIKPDEALLKSTLLKTQQKQRRKNRPHRTAMICVAILCLCFTLTLPTLAASVEPIYNIMYLVSPTIAQFFMPVQKSSVDQDIRLEVLSAYVHDNVAEVYLTLQDLKGDRVDETTDLFDSYAINRSFDSTAYCTLIGYDATSKTATFLVTIEQWQKQNIKGDKITFSLREFLSHKSKYEDIHIPIDTSQIKMAKETQLASNITGNSGHFSMTTDIRALVPTEPNPLFPVNGIDLTGIGYIDGKLHVQTRVIHALENDNHGFFYFKDLQGNKITPDHSFTFIQDSETQGRITYANAVFDIPETELSSYALHGDFITSGLITKGNWRVTFPLE